MERLNKLPIYRRFGFRIFFFNALLIICVMAPVLGLRDRDYKTLMDRGEFQQLLFYHIQARLESMPLGEIPQAGGELPRILPSQRLIVLSHEGEVLLNQIPLEKPSDSEDLIPWLPTPYMDFREQPNPNPQKAIDHYKGVLEEMGGSIPYGTHRIINLQYQEGMDRVIFHGQTIATRDDRIIHVFLQSSVIDILEHRRALKEQYTLLFLGIAALGFLLAMVLSWSVTLPLRSVYRLSLKANQNLISLDHGPHWGELGEIRHTIQGLMTRLQERAGDLYDFSSDMVHQLKTPMAALRSGLELYTESDDEEMKAKLLHGLFLKMQQMEQLMNQVENLGRMEIQDSRQFHMDITPLLESLSFEFPGIVIQNGLKRNDVLSLELSEEKLHILLSSLISNAVDFSPASNSVELQVQIKESFLFLGVIDQGPGIAPEVIDQITQRFFSYRLGNQGKHSGLGLAMVQSILQSCGGSLDYGNNPKKGAFFHCWVPLSS